MFSDDDLKSVYEFYCEILAKTISYFQNFAAHAFVWLIAYACLCIGIYFVGKSRWKCKKPRSCLGQRALLVIAHPDDECMFFGPTIYGLLEQAVDVHVLCLSDGNSAGLGVTRRKELWSACTSLGVPAANICLVTDARLPDDPESRWPAPVLAHILLHTLEAYDIDVLVTFDKHGVSGHSNHSSLFYAIAYLFVENKMPDRCTVYILDSVNILRKYWGYLDLPLSYMLSSDWYFLSWRQSSRVVRAMRQHRSQMVWFRRLYVLFSRYMLINTLREISLVDIELELAVED